MRRSHANQQEGFPSYNAAAAGVEEENEVMTEELKFKIDLLRSLAIDMGTEVKYHNKMIGDMSDDFEHSRGFLGKTMERVIRLGRGGHNYYLLILFLFCMFVFFLLWIFLKIR